MRRITMVACRWVVCLVLVGGMADAYAAEAKEAVAKFVEQLRVQGLDEAAARKVAPAMAKAEELERAKPLWPLLEDKSFPVCMAAAITAIAVEPEPSSARVIKAILQGRGNAGALLFSLSFSYQRSTVGFLVKELAAGRGAERDEAALFALQVLTGHSFEKPAEWTAWWKEHGASLTLTEPGDAAEQERRMQAVLTLIKTGKLKAALAPIFKEGKQTPAKPGEDPLENAIGGMFRLMEQGAKLQLSEAALEGDRLFSAGEFAKAEAAFGRAMAADGRDLRSAVLRGCVLFELGRREEAAAVFEKIAAAEPKAAGAQLLGRLCAQPVGTPLLPAAREELAAMSLPGKDERDEIGWGDPLLTVLLSQQMAGGGPQRIPRQSLDDLAERHAGDVEVLCGIAMSRPAHGIFPAFAMIREKFPRSPLPLCGWLWKYRSAPSKIEKSAVIAAAQEWAETEPANGLPALLVLNGQQPFDFKGPNEQPYDQAAFTTIAAAARQPEFHDHNMGLCRAVRRVRELTGCPFALLEISQRPGFGEELSRVMFRLRDREKASRAAGHAEEAESTAKVIDELSARMLAMGGSDVSKVMMYSGVISAWRQRKKDLAAAAGPAEEIAKLEAKIAPLETKLKTMVNLREASLQMLPLPALQREIVDEVLARDSNRAKQP